MQTYPVLRIHPGKEIHLRLRHHAIYKPAIQNLESVENGGIAEIQDFEGKFLCYATINTRSYIAGRVISFEKGDPLESLGKQIKRSIELRSHFFQNEDTTAFRLINAEGDSIPGLVVDKYGDVLVVQITTLGMDRLRDWIVATLWNLCKPHAIFEKSTSGARKKEGMESREGWLKGATPEPIPIKERGLTYHISLTGSQKTGLFLDQREMRSLVRSLAAGRTVLDCCSYVGGFSLSALAGGAVAADAVDYDDAALARAKEHMQLNGINADQFQTYKQDVFEFLRQRPLPHQYDFIVLDPPAFAKRSSDIDQAKGAYTDLNRLGFQALTPGGLLLTCSCSYQMDAQLFQTVVFHAARQANRNVRIVQRHRHAFDHPVNLYHPEADYLKSMLLYVE